MLFTVAGQAVRLLAENFEVEQTVGMRAVARFCVADETNSLLFDRGQHVVLSDGGITLFGGIIDTVRTRLAGAWRKHDLTVVDWTELTSRRIAARSWENQTAGTIVADLIDSYLADEGIVAGTIDDGPIIVAAVANYAPVQDVLDALAEKAGLAWWLDPDKGLHFRDPASIAAPFRLDTSTIVGRIDHVDWGNVDYRNRQYVRGGKDVTDPQTETKTGDGESREFTFSFPLAQAPTVKVNGAAQTVGVKGVDSGKDWYWAKGDAVLAQEATHLRLTSADELEVTYVGEYSIIALAEDPVEIAARAVEGGTGMVEAVFDAPDITGRDIAFEVATGRLDRFGVDGARVTVRTPRAGLAPGQTVRVWYPHQSLDRDMLVESTKMVRHGAGFAWDVTCVTGPTRSWAQVFDVRQPSAVDLVNVGGGDVLALLTRVSERWAWSEQVDQTAAACTLLDADLPFALC